MEVQEGNKLIAEFMGTCSFGEVVNMGLVNISKYHTSWDWLMPVVRKILHEPKLVAFRVGLPSIEILQSRFSHSISINYLLDIKLMWQTVVQFLQWYNSLNGGQNKKL